MNTKYITHLLYKKISYTYVFKPILDYLGICNKIIVQINHPLCCMGLTIDSFMSTGSMSLSVLFWATMLSAYQFSNLFRRNCLAVRFTLTSSGCSRSVQFGGTMTYIKSLLCSKFSTLLVVCPLNSSKITNPLCFKSKPSCLLLCVI